MLFYVRVASFFGVGMGVRGRRVISCGGGKAVECEHTSCAMLSGVINMLHCKGEACSAHYLMYHELDHANTFYQKTG